MSRIYLSVADEISERPFKCIIAVSYFRRIMPDVPEETTKIEQLGWQYSIPVTTTYIEGAPISSSFYNPVDANRKETAYLPVTRIVDAYIKQASCEIVNDLDIVHMFNLVDRYLRYAERGVRDQIPEFISFCKNLLDFRKEFLYPCFRRIVYKYPNLKAEYRTFNTGTNDTWLSIFGTDKETFTDGIDALRYPPFDIDSIINVKEEKQVTDINGNKIADPNSDDDFLMNELFKDWSSNK